MHFDRYSRNAICEGTIANINQKKEPIKNPIELITGNGGDYKINKEE